MPDYIAAIDQGTTSTRFLVFTAPAASSPARKKEHQQIYPQPGWVEHDPEEIWRRTREVIAEAMAQRGLRPTDLAAIGITNQRETTVLWDRHTGKPVAQRARLAGYARGRYVSPNLRATAGPTASAPRPACRWPHISAR